MAPLMTATTLAQILADKAEVTILDVRWSLGRTDGRELYLQGHLPGAHFVDLDTELAGAAGASGRHPLPDVTTFADAMRRAGVSTEIPVICYDAGHNMAAARLWWMLTDAGHPHVHVLNGGLAAWQAIDGPLETGPVPDGDGDFVPAPGHRESVTVDALIERLNDGGRVVDVRANDRYRGENETVDPVAGHIPGAVSLPLGVVASADGYAADDVLQDKLSSLRPGDVVSCGSGITASAMVLAAEQAGITGLVLYPGSWSEWIADPSRPVATGDQPGSL